MLESATAPEDVGRRCLVCFRGWASLCGWCARGGMELPITAFFPLWALRCQDTACTSSRSSCKPPLPLGLQRWSWATSTALLRASDRSPANDSILLDSLSSHKLPLFPLHVLGVCVSHHHCWEPHDWHQQLHLDILFKGIMTSPH